MLRAQTLKSAQETETLSPNVIRKHKAKLENAKVKKKWSDQIAGDCGHGTT